eukprot:2284519-Ditylum_brightwellii.AAC.1
MGFGGTGRTGCLGVELVKKAIQGGEGRRYVEICFNPTITISAFYLGFKLKCLSALQPMGPK